MDNSSIAKELTIIIPLKDRPEYTLRLLRYMEEIWVPFKVIFADGSKDDSAKKLLSEKRKLSRIDYEYIRYPYDQGLVDYYAKLNDSLSRVSTPLVAMFNNDDLFCLDGLRASVEFLKSHPDYSACAGQSGIFSLLSWDGNGSGHVYGDAFWPSLRQSRRDIDAGSAFERVREHLTNYEPTYFDVQRTPQAREKFKAIMKFAPKDILLYELATSLFTAAKGKIKKLTELYLLRQRNAPGSSSVEEYKKMDIFERMLYRDWSTDFSGFAAMIAGEIARMDKRVESEVEPQIKKWYRVYIKTALISALSGKPQKKGNGVFSMPLLLKRKASSLVIKTMKNRLKRKQVYLMDIPHRYCAHINSIREFLINNSSNG